MAEEPHLEEGGEQPRNTSLLPWAMLAAFVGGAGVAGFLVFGDQLGQWVKSADLAWMLDDEAPVVIESQTREVLTRSSGPPEVVDVSSTWVVEPLSDTRMPGGTVVWTQTLRRARYRATRGTEVALDASFPEPVPTVDPEAPVEEVVELPRTPDELSSDLVGHLIGVPIAGTIEPDSIGATASAAPEEVETLARAWYRVETDRNGEPEPMPEGALDNVQLALDEQVGQIVRAVGPMLVDGEMRPGQSWTRTYPVEIGPWGEHDVKFDLSIDRIEGDETAVITALLSRRPRVGEALGGGDTLSGLRGTGEYWFDIASHRPLRGVTRLEATGKVDRLFAKVTLREAFALGDAGSQPAIPAELLADLPLDQAEPEPEPAVTDPLAEPVVVPEPPRAPLTPPPR